jgi:hypothetical protein
MSHGAERLNSTPRSTSTNATVVLANSLPPSMLAAIMRRVNLSSITLTADEIRPAVVVMTTDGDGVTTLEVRA